MTSTVSYHLVGTTSTAIFMLCLIGIVVQLAFILKRRRRFADNGAPTAVLSLNQFASSYVAFLTVFIYGFCLERFDHYLVWPRLTAAVAVLAIMREIMRDRRDLVTRAIVASCTLALVASLALMASRPSVPAELRTIAQWAVVASSLVVAQGFWRQIVSIRRSGHTGAVALRMHQLTFAKDVATMLFGLAMGIASGWPLVVTNGVCALAKLGVMWQFRWARLSPVAAERRAR
jgi:hypothetical protein